MPNGRLALRLAATIRHDGAGGVADDLADPAGLAAWLVEHRDLLPDGVDAASVPTDEQARAAVVALRAATRSLLARCVPAPSRADAHRLLPVAEAVERVNAAAALAPVAPVLAWPDDGPPAVRSRSIEPDAVSGLTAALARSAIDFLTGPDRERLRACTAPRCVRYFLQSHGRQEFCKPSCSNRARAARHYQRRHATDTTS
ncbi:putative RNA-binding Zn ribbon-like protein [Actinoalloteichus hoggarensis]|uniref:CGNR zinc finger n=1 Tax=Actinoalloteichus hoggarensis TaxID=1470176 RepID=A0A221W7Z8_9PSEU|nr:ABATE domain-containing protein [Actinoalloteichus hoggarensis]ASO21766.1 CGNR zinc finger [Actinoalloteichus hoggarensis]MBB5922363.1 putative RNA-binding Zn ribbon-like protein [Actinoalloteichus hoggarensis]